MRSQTETKCNEARASYETTNQTLTEDIPRLLVARVAYVDPILQAFVRTQYKFYTASAAEIQPLTKYFGPEVGEVRARAVRSGLVGSGRGRTMHRTDAVAIGPALGLSGGGARS